MNAVILLLCIVLVPFAAPLWVSVGFAVAWAFIAWGADKDANNPDKPEAFRKVAAGATQMRGRVPGPVREHRPGPGRVPVPVYLHRL